MKARLGKFLRVASAISTSRPGLIFSLTRWYPPSSSRRIVSISASIDGWIPMATPQRIRSRVPPRRAESGLFARFAKRSQTAISTVAFAMLCPRTPGTRLGHEQVRASAIGRAEEFHGGVALAEGALEGGAAREPPLEGELRVASLQLLEGARDLDK